MAAAAEKYQFTVSVLLFLLPVELFEFLIGAFQKIFVGDFWVNWFLLL